MKKLSYNTYKQWLPLNYNHKLDSECDLLVLEIKKEINFLLNSETDIKRCVSLLQRFILFHYNYKKDDQIYIINSLYKIIFDKPNIDYLKQTILANELSKILRKKTKLENLIIPWRPMYLLLKKLHFPKSRNLLWVPKTTHAATLVKLIRRSRYYFSDSAESEILEELRPYLCPHDQSIFFGYGMLTLFLPTKNYKIDDSKEYYGNYQFGQYLWLDEIISVSSWMENSPHWDSMCMSFLARVAKSGKNINWEPFIPVLFSKILRLVANSGTPLPVGTTNFPIPGNISLPQEFRIFISSYSTETTNMIYVATLIVYILSPLSSCQKYLSQLMEYIEPYYHPSNFGNWSSRIGILLKIICSSFVSRCAQEKEYKNKFNKLKESDSTLQEPEHFKKYLSDSDIDKFVLCMLPIGMKALYSKQPLATSGTIAIKHLAFIRPKLVFPLLLENIVSDLQTIDQTHRIQASLEILGVIVRPLLWRENYLEGGKYLSELLLLSLPGIDANDLMKTLATIRFYTSVLINVPLIDCSSYINNNDSEYDIQCRQVTAYFADWALQFLERALVLYSFTVSYSKTSSFSLESTIHGPLYCCLGLLFQQASSSLFDRLLLYVFNFTRKNHIHSAIKEIGTICEVLCLANPEKTLELFIPYYYSILFPTSDIISFNHLSDSELSWIFTIILSLVRKAGVSLLKYKKSLEDILNIALSSIKTRKLYKLSCQILQNILDCLSNVYILEKRSVPLSIWNSDDFQNNTFKYWAIKGDHDNLDIQWHNPSKNELQWVTELINKYGNIALESLNNIINNIETEKNEYINNNNNNSINDSYSISKIIRKQIYDSLYILSNILSGCGSLLQNNIDEENNYSIPKNAGYTYNKDYAPKYIGDILNCNIPLIKSNVNITSITKIIIHLCLLLEDSDDIKLIGQVIKIIHKILNAKYCESPGQSKAVLSAIFYSVDCSHLTLKYAVRYFITEQISLNHIARCYANNFCIHFSSMICNLLFCLIKLSVNPYSKIRAKAQSIVALSLVRYNIDGNFIVPQIISYLQPNSPSNHVTGAVYMLHSSHLLSEIIGNWKLFKMLVFVMCDCYKHDSPTVQKRIISLFESISELFYTAPLSYKPINGINISENKLLEMENKTKENYKIYHEITKELSSVKLPWNYTIGIGNFLMLLLREDILPSIEITNFFHSIFSSDITHLQTLGFTGLNRIFLIYKPKRLTIIQSNNNNNNNCIKRISVNEYKEYINNSNINNEETWENANFQDKNYFGWGSLPTKWKSYAPMSKDDHNKQINRIYEYPTLKFMFESFNSEEWWDLLITRLSTEVSGAYFQKSTAQCFKGLFQIYYDSFLHILLPKILILSKKYQENGCQLLACHIIAGLVRGSKHWPYNKLEKLWESILIIFEDVLEFATSTNISNWMMCINFCVYDRDPRRLNWLRNKLFNAPDIKNNLSAILQSKRIQALTGVLSECSWKGSYYGDKLIDILKIQLSCDRKLIRGSLASLSATILSSNYDGLRDNKTNIPSLRGNENLNPKLVEFIQCMINELDRTQLINSNDLSEEDKTQLRTDRTNCCTFILNWIISCFNILVAHTLLLYLPPLLPKLLAMRDDDNSTMQLLYTVIGYIANAEMSRELAIQMLQACYDLLESSSWHTRATILPFMQVLVFKNIFVLSSQVPLIVQALVDALIDPQLEVRALASKSLAGVLKFVDDESILTNLQKQFLEMANTSIPERKYRKTDPTFQSNLLKRHGGVLGLSALIQVHPYEIPLWLPELLVLFAVHINDPMPINNTVKKTFLEFWRVHQDAWATEKLLFTQSQLTLLTELLVSPSYFA